MKTRYLVTNRDNDTIDAGGIVDLQSFQSTQSYAMKRATENPGECFDVWVWRGSATIPVNPVWTSMPQDDADTD